MTRVSVVGLGKLGACMLAVFSTPTWAGEQHEVTGVDLSPSTAKLVNEGKAPVVEPQLAELLVLNRGHYRATVDFAEIVDTSMTFVIVPTPTEDAGGRFTNKYVIDAVTKIGTAIRHKRDRHTVVITSTVMPGSTMGPIMGALTMAAQKQLGDKLALCYSPEFIALGSVIRDLSHPDLLLISGSDKMAELELEGFLRSCVSNQPQVARLTIPEAEIAKIAINSFVTMKVSFANSLAELCERTPMADATAITAAIGKDSRIGTKYLKPATAFGGPCFPRDNRAFARAVPAVQMPLAEATDDINDRQVARLADIVENATGVGTICILGMAYKPNTPVIDASAGVALAEEMYRRGFSIVVHDPLASEELARHFRGMVGDRFTIAPTAVLAVAKSDVVVVAQPCDEYRQIEPAFGDRTVVDLWALYGMNTKHLRPGVYQWNTGRKETTNAL